MATAPVSGDELAITRRRWWRWAWLPGLLVLLACGWWWLMHPADLPTSDRELTASVKAGQTVYLGVPAGDTKGRTLDIRSASIEADGADVSLWVCHGGSVSTTTNPEPFCSDWTEAEGSEFKLADGDQLVVGVQADSPGTVEVGRVTLDFNDGLQRGSSPFGPTYAVDFLG